MVDLLHLTLANRVTCSRRGGWNMLEFSVEGSGGYIFNTPDKYYILRGRSHIT